MKLETDLNINLDYKSEDAAGFFKPDYWGRPSKAGLTGLKWIKTNRTATHIIMDSGAKPHVRRDPLSDMKLLVVNNIKDFIWYCNLGDLNRLEICVIANVDYISVDTLAREKQKDFAEVLELALRDPEMFAVEAKRYRNALGETID